MDKTILVDADIEAGRTVVQALERDGIDLDVVAWLQDDETGVWQLVVSSPTGGETGARPIYEAILRVLNALQVSNLDLDNFLVASPHKHLIRDLKRKVGTDHGFHDIRMDLLGLGGRLFRSSRILRVVGNAIGHGARVRVKATGQMGTVRGVIDTPHEPRYLVLYDRSWSDIRPLSDEPRPPIGQDYGEQDLDFLYVVRTGGWPETIPDWLRQIATSGAAGI